MVCVCSVCRFCNDLESSRYLCFATQSAVNLPLPTAYTSCIQVVYIFIYDFGMPLDDHPCLDSLVENPDYEDPFNARHAEQVSRRGGGTSSNLGGPLLNFHLQCSLGGASRHLARTRSQVHFWLAI